MIPKKPKWARLNNLVYGYGPNHAAHGPRADMAHLSHMGSNGLSSPQTESKTGPTWKQTCPSMISIGSNNRNTRVTC
jgi:hypothetical protein